jgi:excisionase family DNA binding protein
MEKLDDLNKKMDLILEMLNALPDSKLTLNIQEAAEYLGIGQIKIRELIDKKNTDFPFFKVGSKSLMNRKMLDEWLIKISAEKRVI